MKKSIVVIFLILASSQVLASTSQWRPLVAIGGGFANTINLGKSIDFPIVSLSQDEYYYYSPTNQTQTKGLFEAFLGIEHPVFGQWLLQTGVAYTQPGSFLAAGNFIQGVDVQSQDQYQYQYNVRTRQILLQTKWMYPVHNRFYPYALIGLGAAINTASNYSTTAPYTQTFTRLYADNTSTTFAYRLGIGLDVDWSPQIRLGIAYRISDLGGARLGQGIIDQNVVQGTLSQSAIYANEVLAQLTYHF